MEREDKRGIFFGVIGVLTLIVAIIGASLAYFSINARSKTDALIVKAATVKIVYEDGDKLNVSDIIPSEKRIAIKSLTRAGESDGKGGTYKECIDDNGYTVCGYYDFTLTNEGPNSLDIVAKVIPTALKNEEHDETGNVTQEAEIGFKNLKFVLYDISDDNAEFSTLTGLSDGIISYSEFSLLGSTEKITIEGNGTVKKLRLFVWLDEAGDSNDVEQGAVFKGTVNIEVLGAENITGTITD